ncbi:PstS family phosphate ABC transporter substrate-binding protein [Parasediminibacterium sp. JCM 36343]|uniref:PstS family phosphate ABC transporter substrate-binding protein n=1 Tax=Parasediminibacterium sp. JCM 36343 TaxID=3374279 RepID=UPI00397C054D
MKKVIFSLSLLAVAYFANAQQTTIRIAGTRLTYPLMQKWIDEYSKQHPGTTFILNSKIPADSVDISIVSHKLAPSDIKPGKTYIALSRYVQLPVVNSSRPDVAALQEKGFTDASFKEVYFDEKAAGNTLVSDAVFTVYKRKQSACASQSFANHFGSEQKDIKGIGVVGDDKDLLSAVKQDKNGISYNNLGFIYNIQTRKLVDSIAIVPIDFNENGKIDEQEKIYNNLDEVINYAEKTNSPKLLIENVYVLFKEKGRSKEETAFLKWVLEKGQKYNHQYGFLNLPDEVKRQSAITVSK